MLCLEICLPFQKNKKENRGKKKCPMGRKVMAEGMANYILLSLYFATD